MQTEEIPWSPVLFPKQMEVFRLGTKEEAGDHHPESATAALICGGRETGKTWSIIHRLARHLWETPGAMAAIVHKTTKNITNSGVADDIKKRVFPEWVDANIGFEYTTFSKEGEPGWKSDGLTRTPYLRVKNMHGGESEIRLLPVEHDCEIREKTKSSRWSFIWVNELQAFKDSLIFTQCYELLRMPHLKKWQHLFIADCNPAVEGTEFWAYRLWVAREWTTLKFDHDPQKKLQNEKYVERLKLALQYIEIQLEDNLRLTEAEIEIKKALHQLDPGEFSREVEGKWVAGSGGKNKLFKDAFSRDVHVIEEKPEENEIIELSSTTTEILVGWDLGNVNHAVVFLERRIVMMNDKEWAIFTALREIESIGERVSVREIGAMALGIMDELCETYGRKLDFDHIADSNAIDTYRSSGLGLDYLEVLQETNGRIEMRGVSKPAGSIETRIRLTRRLLKEKRQYFSSRCPRLIDAIENVSRGTTAREQISGQGRHVIDAYSYVTLTSSASELLDLAFKPKTSDSKQLFSL